MTRTAKEIGERIRAIREKKGWTQEQLAEACGVYGANVISRWEAGKQVPRLDMAVEIADALGLALDELVRGPSKGKGRRRTASSGRAEGIVGLGKLDKARLNIVRLLVRELSRLP